MTASYVRAADLMAGWRAELEAGTPPVLYPLADPGNRLADIEVGPGLVSLWGGPPGAGKTALVMQLVMDALRLVPTLCALVANVEMAPAALLDRQLARLSGIDLKTVRHRRFTAAHAARRAAGVAALDAVTPRLTFLRPPYSVENVVRAADAAEAELVVMDYVQRFAAVGDHTHRKGAVDEVMDYARRMADGGAAVILVAAVGRQKDASGRSGYADLGLASFRESSELEYGADDAFLVVRDDPDDPAGVTLRHVKSRHGETRDIPLRFDGSVQRFDPAGPGAAAADLWAGGDAA